MNIFWESAQTAVDFLGQRDVEELDAAAALNYFQGKPADAILVFGNDLPQVAETGSRAWKKGIGKKLIFCGGIGHSTEILKNRMRRMPESCWRKRGFP